MKTNGYWRISYFDSHESYCGSVIMCARTENEARRMFISITPCQTKIIGMSPVYVDEETDELIG